jgi:hypothetical protein
MEFSKQGDFFAHISYIPVPDGEPGEKEQALIISASNAVHKKQYAAIGLSVLFLYVDEEYTIKRSVEIAEKLGVGAVGGYQVACLINDWLDELCKSKDFEMVKEDRHPNKQDAGEVKLFIDNELVGEQVVHH